MYYIAVAFIGVMKWLNSVKHLIPIGIASIFIIAQFFVDWVLGTLPYAFQRLSKTLFAAELIINESVYLAIHHPDQYGFLDFFKILIGVYILFTLVRFLSKLQINVSGAQARWGTYVIGFLFVAIIQISTARYIDGQFGFIPVWDGLLYLLFNIEYVILGLFTSSYNPVVDVVTENVTNNTL